MKKNKNSSQDQITNFENINKNQKQKKIMPLSSVKNKITSTLNQQTKKYELNIGGKVYESEVENNFTVPLSVVEDLHIDEFPVNLTLHIVKGNIKKFGDTVLIIPRIKSTTGKDVEVELNYCPEANSAAHSNIGYPMFQQVVAELLLSNTKFKPKIISNSFEIDTFHFTCSIIIPKDIVGEMYYSVMDYYYSARWKVMDESRDFDALLRERLKLPAKPNKLAQVKANFGVTNPYEWVMKDGFLERILIRK